MKILKTLLFLAIFYGSKLESVEKKNILVFIVDDLRPELNCYGADQIVSPNIDKIAERGTLFSNAYCQIPVCGASRASIMSGVYPVEGRLVDWDSRADKDLPTITDMPSHLKNHGYYTASVGKVYHSKDENPSSWDYLWRGQDIMVYNLDTNQAMPNLGKPAFEGCDVPDEDYTSGEIAQQTIQTLKTLKKEEKPFFLVSGFTKPHLPFNAPKKYWDLYPIQDIQLASNDFPPKGVPKEALHNWMELRRMYSGIPKEGPLKESLAKKLIQGYYACVSYTDAMIGTVMEELKSLELLEDTIVVLLGDHGYQLSEHGLWCKHALFKTSLQVPLIISHPDFEGGKKSDSMVELVDLYPTISEWGHCSPPNHRLWGKSLNKILQDSSAKVKDYIFARYRGGDAIFDKRFAFSYWANGSMMLYDHKNDPRENKNIAKNPEFKTLTHNLKLRISEHLSSVENLIHDN